MFTTDKILDAFSKVRSGEDFPMFIKDLKLIGVLRYDNFVADGQTIYYGLNDFKLDGGSKYEELPISENSSSDRLKHAILIHQQGETDYPTFCRHAADAGVEKWITDTLAMTVTYVDKEGKELLVEAIPKL